MHAKSRRVNGKLFSMHAEEFFVDGKSRRINGEELSVDAKSFSGAGEGFLVDLESSFVPQLVLQCADRAAKCGQLAHLYSSSASSERGRQQGAWMSRPSAFDGMMHEFCVGLGWCGCVKDGKPLHVTHFIPDAGPVSADEFAKWIMMADGLDPDQPMDSENRRWMRQLREVFVKHMGADVVDASKLRCDHQRSSDNRPLEDSASPVSHARDKISSGMTESANPKRWTRHLAILFAWTAAVLLDVQFSYGLAGFHSFVVFWLLLSVLATISGGAWYAVRRGPRLLLVGLVSLALAISEIAVGSALHNLKINQSYAAAKPIITAIDAYQRDNGRLPGKLDDLVPAYLSTIPTTKMKWRGTPFGYSRNDSEYRLSFEKPVFLRAIYDSTQRRWISAD